MPVLKNTRHEYFAQSMAKGKSQRQAYIGAGYDCGSENIIDSAASRLLSNVKVSARITELKERAAVKAEISLVSATNDLLRIAKKSEQLEDSSGYQAARAAIMDACKLNGLIIDKAENKNTNESRVALSDADKADIARLAKDLDGEF